MNTYNVNNQSFVNSTEYQNFLKDNPSIGYLNIRAYAASQAIPISDIKIVVSNTIGNDKVIFFEGLTNESGVIEGIKLPAPKLVSNDLDKPSKTTYEIEATYQPDNLSKVYRVNIYENISSIQNIIVAPDMDFKMGGL